jgi:hypothetical protein
VKRAAAELAAALFLFHPEPILEGTAESRNERFDSDETQLPSIGSYCSSFNQSCSNHPRAPRCDSISVTCFAQQRIGVCYSRESLSREITDHFSSIDELESAVMLRERERAVLASAHIARERGRNEVETKFADLNACPTVHARRRAVPAPAHV